MSLAHLFDQPVVKPRPTRVVRGSLDMEPRRAPDIVYTPTIRPHTPAQDAKPAAAMTPEERLAKKRAYGAAYRARQKAAGKKKKRKPYSEFTPEQKAVRRAKQMDYYYANRERIAERERERYRAMTPEEKREYYQRSKEWRHANVERVSELAKARRAKKKAQNP
jgi:hypothetical protein